MVYRLLQAVSPPGLVWRVPTRERVVYLTFDDGPTPGVTEDILTALAAYQATATMFLLGANAAMHPQLVKRIADEGHGIGNHTWSHRNGWSCPEQDYLQEVEETQTLLSLYRPVHFRPPYGKLKLNQLSGYAGMGLTTVMWSGIGWDWDARKSPAQVLQRLQRAAAPGAILVLHDSTKAAPRMLPMLRPLLAWLSSQGYTVRCLPTFTLTPRLA